MKYSLEDKVKILEYKFVFEENLQVKKEYEEGSADLNYRLSFFRRKLDKDKSTQLDIYDRMFMGKSSTQSLPSTAVSQPDQQELTHSAIKSPDNIKPWAKKIYRKIVVATHPDKITDMPTHLKDKLTEQYRITQNAYEREIYSD